jgi:hypothetical protein
MTPDAVVGVGPVDGLWLGVPDGDPVGDPVDPVPVGDPVDPVPVGPLGVLDAVPAPVGALDPDPLQPEIRAVAVPTTPSTTALRPTTWRTGSPFARPTPANAQPSAKVAEASDP